MIIHDLHVVCVAFPPLKTHTMLIVDPTRMLILAASTTLLQPIAGRNSQIFQPRSGIHHVKFAPRRVLDCLPLSDKFIAEESLGILRPERSNHTTIV